jgi:hypothetical protein
VGEALIGDKKAQKNESGEQSDVEHGVLLAS